MTNRIRRESTTGRKRVARAGFTLAEILVVVVMLSLIAAFVLPDVVSRLDDAEPARIVADLRGITDGIAMFNTDTRNAYPGDLEDLIHRIVSGTDKDVEGKDYTSRQSDRWDGPYLRGTLAANGVGTDESDKLKTGFDGFILSPLVLWSSILTNAENAAPTDTAQCGDDMYIAVKIAGLSQQEFEKVNAIVDHEDESAASAEGNLRWIADDEASTASGTTYYLAVSCRA